LFFGVIRNRGGRAIKEGWFLLLPFLFWSFVEIFTGGRGGMKPVKCEEGGLAEGEGVVGVGE
jgi:hypothetical protein